MAETHLSESNTQESHPEKRTPKWRRRAERLLAMFGLFTLLGVLLMISPLTDVVFEKMDVQDPLKKADWIICLGGDAGRVVEAVRLLEDGYAPKLVVTNHGSAAHRMKEQAIEWGAPAGQVIVEDQSSRTAEHPELVENVAGIDKVNDVCIIVTDYTHMARAKRIFADAGYKHLIVRELRWHRQSRPMGEMNYRQRLMVAPKMLYEGAGWLRYILLG